MEVIKELKKYTDFVPLEKLQKIVERPISLCAEEIKYLLPSITMGGDGPVLRSLFLLTDNYIFEVRLMSQGEQFDYVALKTIANYRFVLSEHIVKREGKEDLKYEVATVELWHNIGIEFHSDLNYVGNDREAWIKMVAEAIPISIVLKQ
jgi:hypothetical protein